MYDYTVREVGVPQVQNCGGQYGGWLLQLVLQYASVTCGEIEWQDLEATSVWTHSARASSTLANPDIVRITAGELPPPRYAAKTEVRRMGTVYRRSPTAT